MKTSKRLMPLSEEAPLHSPLDQQDMASFFLSVVHWAV